MTSTYKSSGTQIEGTVPRTIDYHIAQPSGVRTDYYGNAIAPIDFSYMRGWKTPNFHKRVKAGELLPHTPFTKVTVKGEIVDSNFHTEGFYNGVLSDERFAKPWTPLPTDWFLTGPDLEALADDFPSQDLIQAVAAKVNNDGHDSLTFLAELVKVRRMFEGIIKKILRLDIPKNFDQFSRTWLEGRYGWRTLVFDLIELEKAYMSLNEKARTRVSERVGNSENWTSSDDRGSTSASASIAFFVNDEYELSRRGSLTADFSKTAFHANPVLTAWELVPWSFVIDWVVNIGQALASISFLTLNGKYAASSGVYLKLTRNIVYDYTYLPVGPHSYTSDCFCESKTVHEIELRAPGSVSSLPQFNLNLNSWKIIDLIALIYQKFK